MERRKGFHLRSRANHASYGGRTEAQRAKGGRPPEPGGRAEASTLRVRRVYSHELPVAMCGCTNGRRKRQQRVTIYGNSGGAIRFFVACSNEYASSIRRGSLHAIPVKLTPIGPGFASNPGGNGGVGAFGTNANGTMTVG